MIAPPTVMAAFAALVVTMRRDSGELLVRFGIWRARKPGAG
jgi:hypothetical protein